MKEYWIWLTQIPNIGPVARWRLLDALGTPKSVYEADELALYHIKLTKIQRDSILHNKCLEKSYGILEKCEKSGIRIITINDTLYPRKALVGTDTPILLYTRGEFFDIDKSVGIIGARRCTQIDKQKTIDVTKEYIQRGFSIISGMAKGTDAYAHTVCLKEHGKTVAVLGNGLDICYPKENMRLMEQIIERGLLISEYPPGTLPRDYQFPRRNRIISAWSDELCIITNTRVSGTDITADYAQKYNRNIIRY